MATKKFLVEVDDNDYIQSGDIWNALSDWFFGDIVSVKEHAVQLRTDADTGDGTNLRSAIDALSIDLHCVTSRPCPTCNAMSKALGRRFGCDKYRFERNASISKPTADACPNNCDDGVLTLWDGVTKLPCPDCKAGQGYVR